MNDIDIGDVIVAAKAGGSVVARYFGEALEPDPIPQLAYG